MTQYVLKQVKKAETPITLWLAGFALFSLFALYVYFINGAIAFAVESKELNTASKEAVAVMSDLETSYTELRSAVNESLAQEMGFKKSNSEVRFVTIGTSRGLSFNNEL